VKLEKVLATAALANTEAVITRDNTDGYSTMSTNQLKKGMLVDPEMSHMSNILQAMPVVISGVHIEIIFRVLQSCCSNQPRKALLSTQFKTLTHTKSMAIS
jgi:hypothetical protein